MFALCLTGGFGAVNTLVTLGDGLNALCMKRCTRVLKGQSQNITCGPEMSSKSPVLGR